MNTILSPQARECLSASIQEILAQYNVSESVADKLTLQIVDRFGEKVILRLQEAAKINEAAIMQEALKQCQNQTN